MERLPNLDLPLIQPSQAQKHVTHNEALMMLDCLVQPSVISDALTIPPATPAEGDRYIVATEASGDWQGRDGMIAAWQAGSWQFHAPRAGWSVVRGTDSQWLVHDGDGWHAQPLPGEARFETLGVNADTSGPNRLAVASEAALLTHTDESGNCRLHINRETDADQASLVFSTGYAADAEFTMGEAGHFVLKTSDTNFPGRQVLRAETSTGRVLFGPGSMPAYPTDMLACRNGDALATFRLTNTKSATLFLTDEAQNRIWQFQHRFLDGAFIFAFFDQTWTVPLTMLPTIVKFDVPVRLPNIPLASLPAGEAGAMAFVPNASGGPALAVHDGTTWRKCALLPLA